MKVRRGLSQHEMVAAWEKESGVRISRSTIAMAMRRYDIEAHHPYTRNGELIPWKLAPQHRMASDARLLRLEGRRRRGEELKERDLRWLSGWLNRLREADAVVTYHPDTVEGFHWTPRKPDDTDIIRLPVEEAS